MFSAEQHELFSTAGYVRLEGAVPSSDVREMYGRIWSLLEEKGFNQNDPSTWNSGPVGALHELKKGEFAPNNIWHFDHPYFRPEEIAGVNVFLFTDDVESDDVPRRKTMSGIGRRGRLLPGRG